MSDDQVQAYRNVPVGTSAGLKVDLGADNDATVTNTKYVNAVANDASLASGAVILTYTPTVGSTALVLGVNIQTTSGTLDTAVVAVILVDSDGPTDLLVAEFQPADMDTLTGAITLNVALEAGDVLELEVTTVDATETADCVISAIEIA